MSVFSVPGSVKDITAEWLTDVLRDGGYLQSVVSGLEIEPMAEGVGLLGEVARLRLEYQADEISPATLVVKCAAQNQNRELARCLSFYDRELEFYKRMADRCPMQVPKSYYSDLSRDSYDFVLLLDDHGNASSRDQLIGASRHEAFTAIRKLAELHASFWGLEKEASAWMYDSMTDDESHRLRDVIYLPALEAVFDNYGYLLSAEHRDLCRQVGENYSEYWSSNLHGADTFIHGDYRQDNMLYQDGQDEPLVLDWQISGRGKGIFDVAYFMCQSMQPELRRQLEDELLEQYVAALAGLGIDYSLADCRADYRRIILGCLIYPISVCGNMDTGNERGRALAESMMVRNLAAIDDQRSAELVW